MGIGWGPGAHLEAEGRLNGGSGAEPPTAGVRGRQPPGALLACMDASRQGTIAASNAATSCTRSPIHEDKELASDLANLCNGNAILRVKK